ncbi:MAG: sulfatase-like hydrolase/transferase [Akkermansiaceae bacterium]|jgi:arylsulfatase A
MKILPSLAAVTVWLLASVSARQPNVVLIMADDLGFHDLGCYGHPVIQTPVLDGMADRGIRLTDFHSGATVCTPSRMALLTGVYPTRLGWTQGVVGYKMGVHEGMSGRALTLAEIFRSAGYATGISGKWHIGDQEDTNPNAQGFDSAYYLTMSNNQTKQVWRDGTVVEDPFENRLLSGKFTMEAKRFIREQGEKPFFLYLPFTAPHFPVQAHPDWKGKSKFGTYGEVVEELDARVGEVLEELKKSGVEENTIVVFCSDNGPNPGEKAGSLPYRGEKWSALEGGTRVPCLVTWPGKIPGGRVLSGLTSAMDLLPTLSEACGIDWRKPSNDEAKIDGVSLWKSWQGEGEHTRTELLYWHGLDAKPQAIRVGDWKLFFDRVHALEGSGTKRATPEQVKALRAYRAGLKEGKANPPILFHVSDDPGETIDLSEKYPEKVTALRERAAGLMKGIEREGVLPLSKPAK